MKQFEKWLKTFYKNHRGDMRFDPQAKQGWRGVMEEVLGWLDNSSGHKEIADKIHDELES